MGLLAFVTGPCDSDALQPLGAVLSEFFYSLPQPVQNASSSLMLILLLSWIFYLFRPKGLDACVQELSRLRKIVESDSSHREIGIIDTMYEINRSIDDLKISMKEDCARLISEVEKMNFDAFNERNNIVWALGEIKDEIIRLCAIQGEQAETIREAYMDWKMDQEMKALIGGPDV